ncbi:MAG: CAP domain-containing protein [Oscillospiraceae bacterium]|mgnify:FL=1|jgi:SCP-like extracellular|nr:CAP domain-containing protein [Oscillospiraceae bacterium]
MKLKKLSAACLAALISTVGLHSFMPESGFNSTAYAAETITGDANGDGKVTALDAAFIARKLAEQKGSELPSNADYNGDKKTTAGDAAAIAFRLANNYNITKMIELTNNERTKKGIAPLKFDEGLTAAAMVRARESASSFSHTRPNKESFYTILDDFNLTWMSAAENIAAGNAAAGGSSPEMAMDLWINSSGHYNNMIDKEYNKMGVGCIYVANSTYGYYWVQLFSD